MDLVHPAAHAIGGQLFGEELGVSSQRLGVDVRVGHAADAVASAATVVRSSAIADDNQELVAAREANLRIVTRGALLAEVLRTRDVIAIAGSHGKTTTSAMAAHLLESAGLDPLALIGGRVPRPGGDASPVKLGRGDLIVGEVALGGDDVLREREQCLNLRIACVSGEVAAELGFVETRAFPDRGVC